MNNRQRFFNLLDNKELDRTPFFPDITTWYEYTRKNFGEEEIFGPGVFIPDGIDFHKRESRLKGKFSDMTFLDYYRYYDWGLPVHIYDWYETTYSGGIEKTIKKESCSKVITYKTPKGTIEQRLALANDGSWAAQDHFVKEISDLEIIKYIYQHRNIIPRFEQVEDFHKATAGFGVCDLVIWRSPFGKLVHEFMGFENVVYALFDHEETILDFLSFLEYYDLEIIRLAAESPARLVIISDHADENLISPLQYKQYCIPFYQKACKILHSKGKYISTHLDGNFKSYFPFIKEGNFDLLDGCTPAPMFSYQVEELAQIVDNDLHSYCGVPSTLFTQDISTEELVQFGERIVQAFNKRVIVNIGDILPSIGNIKQVIEVGKAVMTYK